LGWQDYISSSFDAQDRLVHSEVRRWN
jgi:hypothetical protein